MLSTASFNAAYTEMPSSLLPPMNLIVFLLRQTLLFLSHQFPKQHWTTAKVAGLLRSGWAAEATVGNSGKLPEHPLKTGGEKGWVKRGGWKGVSFPSERTLLSCREVRVMWARLLGACGLTLVWKHLMETHWVRNGDLGLALIGATDYLLPSEIPCTGVHAPSAILDHTFPW